MISRTKTLDEALSEFDRASVQAQLDEAEASRAEGLRYFPLDRWPDMALEDYALGQQDSDHIFCRWMEFRSPQLGSIKGGSSFKHIIFKRKHELGWYFPEQFENERTAWEHLRSDFLQAFDCARKREWEQIDSLEVLAQGPALRLKTLHLYFPDDILPICSNDHLRHFLRLLERPVDRASRAAGVRTNRELLAALHEVPELADWKTKELERFLYWWADPRDTRRVVKIAPGANAKYWDECLQGGYICVGWDEVGDLGQFESKDAFRTRFGESYPYNANRGQVTRKSNELWTLTELEPGDLVVANQGTSKVLAVGEVVEPGYEWREDRGVMKHTVKVKWDTRYEKAIPAQGSWSTVTIKKVPAELFATISSAAPTKGPKRTIPVPVDPIYLQIASSLERKGQAILYGPPGTGKTYTARRFAVWWLLRDIGEGDADAVFVDPERMDQGEKKLSTAQVSRRVWWGVANPKHWSWDQLRRDGKVTYRYGRLRKNYPLVQPGDLVIGYQATPDKKIAALARVGRGLAPGDGGELGIELKPLASVENGLTYEELLADPILSKSEPIRLRCQGTLFALSAAEADHLVSLLVERNPEVSFDDEGDAGEIGRLTRVTFHPSYTYEDFIEGFRPSDTGEGGLSLQLEDGIFKRVCRPAHAHPDRPYLILVDEINRGNVAKILGELLTLLEKDKRGLTVSLPQSKEMFSIPPNVYLLGTMNTADRSIKLLDAALRRRFAFIELMPDIELLRGATVGELALDDFLEGLNRRIARSEGREKQVGHSYLLEGGEPVSEVEDFARCFREEILPLLQEYCYDEYGTLAKFIGSGLVDAEAQSVDREKVADPDQLVAELAVEFGAGREIED